jgi:hypothetical protein
MAEKGEKRDPSSHRTPGQIKRMNRGYDAQPHKIKERTNDGKARKLLGLQVGDPRDAHHKKPQRQGGATTKANLKPVHRSKNRGWRDGV